MCRAKECSAMDLQCAGCQKFGHIKRYCNDRTRMMARDTKEHKALAVEDEGEDDTHNMGMVRLATRKAEKKTRQRAQKAEAKEATVEEDKEDVGMITINQVTTEKKYETVRSIVWCPVVQRFIQQRRANHKPLNLEVETLHKVEIKNDRVNIFIKNIRIEA